MAKILGYETLPLDKIDVSELNVRHQNAEENINELANSIRDIGVQQPVVVFREGERYKLIIGQRRYLAAKRIGLAEIPSLITEKQSELDATVTSFSENIHRLDLDYKDKMQVAIGLLGQLKTVRKVAEKLGVSEQTVRNYVGYQGVPDEIKKMVTDNQLSASTAMRIAQRIADPERALAVAKLVKDLPRSEDKLLLIDSAREHPDKGLDAVSKIAKESKHVKLTLDLTPRVIRAIDAASDAFGNDRPTVATIAIEDWLKTRGYLSD